MLLRSPEGRAKMLKKVVDGFAHVTSPLQARTRASSAAEEKKKDTKRRMREAVHHLLQHLRSAFWRSQEYGAPLQGSKSILYVLLRLRGCAARHRENSGLPTLPVCE